MTMLTVSKFLKKKTLPKPEHFFNTLDNKSITEKDYTHVVQVWKEMNIKNKGDYHDLYLKTDVLLLADIFENFRKFAMDVYKLEPCHFYTLPGFAWDCLLHHSNINLELITDIDKYLFVEKAKRGGICMITTKYAKANNKYMSDYNTNEASKYIIDLDANNLYGWAMSQSLPVGKFVWKKPESFTTEKINRLKDDSEEGYFLEVDLEYPNELHDLHNNYPVAPENMLIPKEWLSYHSKDLLDNFKMKHGKVPKLMCTLHNKEKYVVHYRTLKLYLQLGLRLKKVHRVLKFNQKPWMCSYINKNTEMRKLAKNSFEKDFFKLMNNAVYGKTMENVRGRIDFELVNDEKD